VPDSTHIIDDIFDDGNPPMAIGCLFSSLLILLTASVFYYALYKLYQLLSDL